MSSQLRIAIADDEPAGVLLLSFRRRLNFATWEGWVPELVVSGAHRRRGIGRALLRVAIEEFLARLPDFRLADPDALRPGAPRPRTSPVRR